jgi:hypothetical protein
LRCAACSKCACRIQAELAKTRAAADGSKVRRCSHPSSSVSLRPLRRHCQWRAGRSRQGWCAVSVPVVHRERRCPAGAGRSRQVQGRGRRPPGAYLRAAQSLMLCRLQSFSAFYLHECECVHPCLGAGVSGRGQRGVGEAQGESLDLADVREQCLSCVCCVWRIGEAGRACQVQGRGRRLLGELFIVHFRV